MRHNRTVIKHGHKYAKHKMCFHMVMVMCKKQHLSNIWSYIHEKAKQQWGWVEESLAYINKRVKPLNAGD